MRKQVLVVLFVFVATWAVAQEEIEREEVFFGYSLIRVNPAGQVNAFNSNGGFGDIQFNVNHLLGILGELGGNSNGNITVKGNQFPLDQTQFSYLFGPRLFMNKTGRVSPFAEYLAGGVYNTRSFSVLNTTLPSTYTVPRGISVNMGSTVTKFSSTQNSFGMAVGGGLDIKVRRYLAIRPVQLDYFPTHFSTFNFSTVQAPSPVVAVFNNSKHWQNNVRFAAGITFRFTDRYIGD
jgi:hypothetical protein